MNLDRIFALASHVQEPPLQELNRNLRVRQRQDQRYRLRSQQPDSRAETTRQAVCRLQRGQRAFIRCEDHIHFQSAEVPCSCVYASAGRLFPQPYKSAADSSGQDDLT